MGIDSLHVQVEGGRWSVQLYPDARLHMFNLVLDGKSLLQENEDYNVPADLPVITQAPKRACRQ